MGLCPQEVCQENTRSFGGTTPDLLLLADWSEECGITSVAMESTGVEWIPLFQILSERQFKVFLVNAKSVKNVPGRKSDVLDCQWLQQLHS
ncbi:MAG UNVERIFIED_CONTAM: transposase [Microcystis novacekii LVE1205-3]